MADLNTKRILLTGIIVFILIVTGVNVIIGAYAMVLGFQAQGAPDAQKISAFATRYAPWLTVAVSFICSFTASIWTARQVERNETTHALLIAATATLLLLICGMIFSASISHNLIAGAAMLLSGWLGARFSQGKKKHGMPPSSK